MGRDGGDDRESLGEARFAMIRRFLYEALLFLLPFALYAVYLRLAERDQSASVRKHPWTFLFASGLVLVLGPRAPGVEPALQDHSRSHGVDDLLSILAAGVGL